LTLIDSNTELAAERVFKDGSKTFFLASRLLPKEARTAAALFYTFCRLADDYIDELPEAVSNVVDSDLHLRLESLRSYVSTLYPSDKRSADINQYQSFADRFKTETGFDSAFALILERYRVPKSILLAMIEGFEWDLFGKQYHNMSDLVEYGLRVAGTVGLVMAMIFGCSDQESLRSAARLGVAMQLTNIARDVLEDHLRGRCYLPINHLYRHGVSGLGKRGQIIHHSQGLAAVIRILLDIAEGYYNISERGISSLPVQIQPAIWMARYSYAGIGHKIALAGYDSISRRHYLTRGEKLAFLGPSLASIARARAIDLGLSLPFQLQPIAKDSAALDLPGEYLLRDFVDSHSQRPMPSP